MKRLICFAIAVAMALSLASCGSTESGASEDISTEQDVVFQGSNASITYIGLSEAPGIAGCLYLSLEIENTGSADCVYNLADVYVNDSSCNTGSGVPIVAQAGKSATGAFIIFTDLTVDDVSSVDFQVEIRDNDTFSLLETSDTISVVI